MPCTASGWSTSLPRVTDGPITLHPSDLWPQRCCAYDTLVADTLSSTPVNVCYSPCQGRFRARGREHSVRRGLLADPPSLRPARAPGGVSHSSLMLPGDSGPGAQHADLQSGRSTTLCWMLLRWKEGCLWVSGGWGGKPFLFRRVLRVGLGFTALLCTVRVSFLSCVWSCSL